MLSDIDQKNQTEYFEKGRDSVFNAMLFASLLKEKDQILFANLLINHALFLNSEEAKLNAYHEAQKTFTLESYPEDYARAQIWIGNVYFDYAPPLNETYIQKSINYYNDALRTLKKYPPQEAYINQKLGLAYGRMGMIKDRERYLQKSTESYSKALEYYTREDHPLEYAAFEGVIPEGNYGAGTVLVWDRGTFANLKPEMTLAEQYHRGRMEVRLEGVKLRGAFSLVKMRSLGEKQWLLIKLQDPFADPHGNPVLTRPESVLSGKTLEAIYPSRRLKEGQSEGTDSV